MTLQAIFAHLSCADLETSVGWFSVLFDRKPDASPMEGLREWHEPPNAGFQLWQDAKKAGTGALTLFVKELDSEVVRLKEAGLTQGTISPGGEGRLCQMRDPDGNLVVLVEPGKR